MNPGDVVDHRYEILRPLGEGGMASVYLARHTVLESEHALKILNPELVADVETRDRFLGEGRIQAQLRHPNIVPVTDVVAEPGVAGLVMEFIDGPTLEDWVDEHAPLTPKAVRELFLPILAGVGEAHGRGIVHRDLKPANVLLKPLRGGGYRPMIADFGIAKIADDARLKHERRNKTRAQMRMGTLSYMSPEQVLNAESVDRRADIFALGAILYELATGRLAFDGPTDYAVMNAIVDGDLSDLDLTGVDLRVAACVRRSLVRDPVERFPDCRVFAEYLSDDAPEIPKASSIPPTSPATLPPVVGPLIAPDTTPTPVPPPELTAEVADVDHGPTLPDRFDTTPAPPRKKASRLWWTLAGIVGLSALACGGVAVSQMERIELYYATHVAHTPVELLNSVWNQSFGIRMRYVPAGSVAMGSPPSESGRDRDEVVYSASITRPFLAMETEVTQAQWERVMGSNPNTTRTRLWDGAAGGACDTGPKGGSYPVTCVDWLDAVAFANALSEQEGLRPAYTISGTDVRVDITAPGYRLPTEAEWMRMAAYNRRGLYGATDDPRRLCEVGNVAGNRTRQRDASTLQPVPCDDDYLQGAPVGRFSPNDLGLYDLVGNAWEWVGDWYTPSPSAGARLSDPTGPAQGTQRVLKGGSWHNPPDVLRVANRYSQAPEGRSAVVGFRLVRTFRPADAGNGQRIR